VSQPSVTRYILITYTLLGGYRLVLTQLPMCQLLSVPLLSYLSRLWSVVALLESLAVYPRTSLIATITQPHWLTRAHPTRHQNCVELNILPLPTPLR
jgi:hypothetical protein